MSSNPSEFHWLWSFLIPGSVLIPAMIYHWLEVCAQKLLDDDEDNPPFDVGNFPDLG